MQRLWVMAWLWVTPAYGQDMACSPLREIAYHLLRTPPDALMASEIRQTNGRRADGGWVWRTTSYQTTIAWPGSRNALLEHYEDQRDSLQINSWQYLVQTAVYREKREAEQAFLQFAHQVQGCVLPDSDSSTVVLQPATADELPLTRPDDLDSLLLFTIPDAELPGRQLLLMAGLEKLPKGWRALLILEAYEERTVPAAGELMPRGPAGAALPAPTARVATTTAASKPPE